MPHAFSAEFAVPPLFDCFAVYIWAVSGAIVGERKGFDMMGVAVVAIVSSAAFGETPRATLRKSRGATVS